MKQQGLTTLTKIFTLLILGMCSNLKAQTAPGEVYVNDNDVYYTATPADAVKHSNTGSAKNWSTSENSDANSPQTNYKISPVTGRTTTIHHSIRMRLSGLFKHLKVVYEERIGDDLSRAAGSISLR